jgi:hypothetical protein
MKKQQQRHYGLTSTLLLLLLLALVILLEIAEGFQGAAANTQQHPCPLLPDSTTHSMLVSMRHAHKQYSKRQNDIENDDVAGTKSVMNPITKSVWYGAEKFGQVLARFNKNNNKPIKPQKTSKDVIDFSSPPSSLDETRQRIRLDNDRSYFLSGKVDQNIYDLDCLFADPFVSFRGRDRFVDNLQNLGSFITNYKSKIIQYDDNDNDDDNINNNNNQDEDAVVGLVDSNIQSNNPVTIKTKIMVKLELNLPWKPILAWPWGVTYEVNPYSYLITKHEESWDIEPWEGIKQIFRKPTLSI